MDASTPALRDTAANAQAFGRPGNWNREAGYSQARFAALVESRTRLSFGATIGQYTTPEISLAESLLDKLRPGML